MGSDKKPIPKRLQLRPEHVAALGHPISFTPAKFDTGTSEETTIVTSTGNFTVTWDFKKVKNGKFYYKLAEHSDTVVADNFRFGQKGIIVAMEGGVDVVKRGGLSTPQKMIERSDRRRSVLTTPARNLQSRSGIVNSPF